MNFDFKTVMQVITEVELQIKMLSVNNFALLQSTLY